MQIKRGIQIAGAAILILGIVAYVVYAVIVASYTPNTERCTAIELNIAENQHAGFISNQSVETELRNAGIYPVDRLMTDISTRQIEDALSKDDFVEAVDCYKTANCHVVINIVQRTPVIYVLPDGAHGYYVDMHGKAIPKTAYPVNMPVATGRISEHYATTRLAQLGLFLFRDEFWNSQIEQIYVSTNADHEYVVDLVPRVGTHDIHLGPLRDFEKKLRRLRIFYEKAVPVVGWEKYSRINLEYEGQIICEKQKNT